MPSERVQRRIDKLLDEAETAADANDWSLVDERARMVLALDAASDDARAFQAMAEQAGAAAAADSSAAPSEDAPVSALPGAFVSGRYQVQEFLGEGARKLVYRARLTPASTATSAFALIKTAGLDADGRARALREAQAMAQLSSAPSIVTVFDSGEEVDQLYLVSEYMGGGDLAAALKDELWDEPTRRVHRAVNPGASPYEEVTVFFLDAPDADPQPGA